MDCFAALAMTGLLDNCGLRTKRKVPPCGGTFLLSLNSRSALPVALIGLLALAVRILLLLSGLLTATLLLARLLSGFLVLLAGILVLI